MNCFLHIVLADSPWRCSHLSGEKTRSGHKYRSAWSFRPFRQTRSDRAAVNVRSKSGIVRGEDKLCMVCIDSGILHHLDQMPCQQRGAYWIRSRLLPKQSRIPKPQATYRCERRNAVSQRIPAPTGSQKPLEVPSSASRVCSAEMIGSSLEPVMRMSLIPRSAYSISCRIRLFSEPPCRMADKCSIQLHFGSHKACQFFKEPQMGLFGLGTASSTRWSWTDTDDFRQFVQQKRRTALECSRGTDSHCFLWKKISASRPLGQ